ncbi:CxxxxCH/CxxCH domain c-type cytochrome [Anaeromyxobacter oryzae]|uniref:Cytochrome c domain-containing protein n=1 Tax=Anaeromyxobacter oryzae TaxID=2918170 RepID=A0ABN6N4A8_9BACT|nr:CxxxxCH/CxxCH domain-containing protein [Anaeromyxobacter oryzae]BDG06858.1 hypothetical protein AMOR_58540 [Anaeromyxobacter oryzae]
MSFFPDARPLVRAIAALGLGVAAALASPAAAQTVVGNGTEPTPSTLTVCPRADGSTDLNAAAVAVDAFTLAATPADTVTRIRVELWPANAYQVLDRVEIRSANLSTVYGSVTPTSDLQYIDLTTPIAVGATPVPLVISIVPKSQSAMPAGVAGAEYAIKAYVNIIISSNARQYQDSTSRVVTVDNLAPANVIWTTITPGATNITLNWSASQGVVVVRKLGGPVSDVLTDGATYAAPTTLPSGAQIVFAGTAATYNDAGLTAGKAYYYRVFSKDACGNYSAGAAIGPIRPGGTSYEGDSVKGSRRVVVGLINPISGVVSSPFRAQVRVFSPKSATGATQAIGTVELVADNGTTQQVFPLERNNNYGTASDSGIFEELTPTVGVTLTPGTYTLRARATSAADAVTPVYSGSAGVTVVATKGDGNLLVRDNSSQICSDCHAFKTHSSETTGVNYGSWYVGCRGCHDPHGTPNAGLIAKQITPPSVTGQYPPTNVYYSQRTGYSGVNGVDAPASASYTNADNSGPCQVCHTQTSVWTRNATPAQNAAAAASHNGTQQCTACHAHNQGLAASCTSCHGNEALAQPFATGADSLVKAAPPSDHLGNTATSFRGVGGHQAHVNKAVLVGTAIPCTECHQMPNTHNGAADPLPFGPTAKSGGLAPAWDGTTCSNVWCHGAGLVNGGGTNKAPAWTGGPSQAQCGTCHGIPPPVSVAPGEDHPQNLSCGDCHTGYTSTTVSATAGHINGTVSSPNKGCVSCHGDLNSVTNGTVVARSDARAAPGSTANAVDSTGSKDPTTVHVGAHGVHVNAGMMAAKTCGECHDWPADGDTTHANGNATPTFPAGGISRTAGVTASFAPGANTCATYCHSNGAPVGGTLAPTAPVWTSTAVLTCTSCHAMGGATTALSSAHKLHTGTYGYTCQQCHERTTTNGTTIVAGGGAHVNGLKEVFDAAGTKGTYNGATLTCSNTYCHSNGTDRTAPYTSGPSIAWTGTKTCTDCHGGPVGTGQIATGKHPNHVNVAGTIGGAASTNFACGACHSSTVAVGTNGPITTVANHANGNPNVVFDATYGGTFSAGAAEGQGTCATNYCHSSGEDPAGTRPNTFKTVTWNGAALDCTGCHGAETGAGTFTPSYGAPNYPNGTGITDANSHQKHVASAADCVTCHAGTVTAAGTAILGTSTLHLDKQRQVSFSGLTGSPTYTQASKTCSNVSCHGAGAPVWGSASLACADCHLSAAADNNNWNINDKVASNINSAEWTSNGHGSAAVAFGAGNTCLYCHDDTGSTHNQAANPFRLRGASAVGGATAAFNAGTNSGNAVCLNCHGTASNGVKPGALALKNGAKKINANHYGTKHGATNNGGQRCWDCHDGHGDANVKMIGVDVLAASSDVYGLAGTRATVAFTYAVPATPAWGDYVKTSAPFNGVCNACHGVSGTTPAAHFTATSGDAAHNPGAACMSCHGHEQGTNDAFKPNGACNACHGSAPATGEHAFHVGTAGGANITYGTTTPQSTPGAYAFSCGKCHTTVGTNHMNDSAHAGTSAATAKVVDVAFDWTSGTTPYTAGATVGTELGGSGAYFRTTNGTCATYCHSNGAPLGAAPTYAAPTWVATTLTCTSCHGNGTSTATMSAKHAKHVSTTTGYSYTCNKCHLGTTTNGTTIADKSLHVNNVNDVKFDAPSAAGAYAQGPSYTCSSVYCHSDGQPLGAASPTYVTGLNWSTGAAMNAECTSCHGGDSTATGTKITSNKHTQHVNQATVLGTNYGCVDCHNATVTANRTLVSPPTTHVNGTKQVGFPARGGQTSAAYASPSCSSNYCHSNGRDPGATDATRYANVTWNQAGVLGCNGCHGRGNATGAPDYANGGTGVSANSHAKHTNSGADATTCQNCHSGLVTAAGTAITGSSHTNGTRNVAILGTYDTNGATTNYDGTTKTCSSVSCHGSGSVQWGATISCSSCHLSAAADVNSFAYNDGLTANIYSTDWTGKGHGQSSATSGTAWYTFSVAGVTDRCVYCHDGSVAHNNLVGGVLTNPYRLRGAAAAGGATGAYNSTTVANANAVCLNCHKTSSIGVDPDGAGGQPLVNSAIAPRIDAYHYGAKHTTDNGGQRCWDCHDPHGDANIKMVGTNLMVSATDNDGWAGTRTATATSFLADAVGGDFAKTASPFNGVCQVCHQSTSYWLSNGTVTTHNTTTQCTNCHAHQDPTPNLAFKGAGDCIGCHTGTQPMAAGGTRRAIVPEFAQAWSHKKSAGGAVTKWDCIVCHMEGDPVTGDPLDAPTGPHKNGVVNLRDPDTGTNIKGVTFTAASGSSPGSYAPTATDLTFTRFSRNLASTTLEPEVQAIMINQCLKCHDTNGAAAYGAGLPLNPLVAKIGGSAEKPFATTIAGTGYTNGTLYPGSTLVGVTANGVAGGVTDVNASFATTNSSYHPVRGAQNNWYAKLTRMAAPWNAVTSPARGATVNATSWGWRISCWDCHALPTDTGTITMTVTAHGGTATLRGNATAPTTGTAAAGTNEATLCKICHAGYDTNTGSSHGTTSAFSSSADSTMTPFLRYGCNRCHSSNYTTAVIRPIRAQDVHGVNALPVAGTKTGRWSTGTDTRPYAFIRNTKSLSSHQPARIGTTTYSATCVHLSDSPCSSRTETYTPGGTY